MVSFAKIRLALPGILMLLVGLSLSTVPALADGNVLRNFDAPNVLPAGPGYYWPIGIAFDGTNLYYSQPADNPNAIFYITTTGTLIRTISGVNNAGALAWDGSHLWVGAWPKKDEICSQGISGCAVLSELDPSTGKVINTLDISAIFAADGTDNPIDGLSYDSATGTLWVSPDPGSNGCSVPVGYAYQIDTSGNLLHRLQFPFGVAGVAVQAKHLWVAERCPDLSFVQVNPSNGANQSSFQMVKVQPKSWAESIVFDPTTFAPNCALWAVQPYIIPKPFLDGSIVAYQVSC